MPLLSVDWSPPPRTLRQFSAAFFVFAGVLGAWLRFGPGAEWSTCLAIWGAGAAVGLAGTAFPRAIRPLYVVLTAVALPVGMVLSFLLLASVYFLLLTPIGLLMRLLGRDPMKRRLDAEAASYWSERRQTEDVRRYYRQT